MQVIIGTATATAATPTTTDHEPIPATAPRPRWARRVLNVPNVITSRPIDRHAGHPDRGRSQDLQDGRQRGPRAARRGPHRRPRRDDRDHGRLGLGQVDAHEHARLPRHADVRLLLARRHAGRWTQPEPARRPAEPEARVRLPGIQPARAHDRRSTTSSCRCCTIARADGRTRRRSPRTRSRASGSAIGWITIRASCPAVSSSASRSRGRSSPSRRCCLPTSPRATSTAT